MERQIIISSNLDNKKATIAANEAKRNKLTEGVTKNGINFKKVLNKIILF